MWAYCDKICGHLEQWGVFYCLVFSQERVFPSIRCSVRDASFFSVEHACHRETSGYLGYWSVFYASCAIGSAEWWWINESNHHRFLDRKVSQDESVSWQRKEDEGELHPGLDADVDPEVRSEEFLSRLYQLNTWRRTSDTNSGSRWILSMADFSQPVFRVVLLPYVALFTFALMITQLAANNYQSVVEWRM